VKSPLQSIKDKCLECSGDNTEEIWCCPVKDCPLYIYRTALLKKKERKVPSEDGKETTKM